MRNFKLVIEYEGTNYQGWQIQRGKSEIPALPAGRQIPKSKINPSRQSPDRIKTWSGQSRDPDSSGKSQIQNSKTIQGEMEEALRKLFNKIICLNGSGRTDSGVHALGQIANFKCETRLKLENIRNALNSYLPRDIRVKQVKEVDEDFHARYSAKSKIYRYLILNLPTNSVFYNRLSWWIPYKLDFSAMRRVSRVFSGRHNFKAFTAADPKRKSDNFVRTIKKMSLKKYRNFIVLDIEADGFLHNMVRNIVGTLVEAGRGKLMFQDVKRILASGDRTIAGPTAPATGLFLIKVKY